MPEPTRKSNCTNIKWVGRSDCAHCHVRHLMLFSGLPEVAFDNNLQPIDHYIFTPGSTLYEAGANDAAIYSIRNGLVKLLNYSPDGKSRIVRMLGRGAVVGLELLEGESTCRHTAIAASEVDACRIPLSTVAGLQKDYPQLCDQVNRQLQGHLDRADQWILDLNDGTARDRVIHLLLMLDELTRSGRGIFKLLRREEMSAMVGLSVETVSRVISALKRQGLLIKEEDSLYSCNHEGLHALLGQVHGAK